MDLVLPGIMLLEILIQTGNSLTFVWEPQKAFSPALQNFDQSCVLLFKSYSESFR
jgi:hypothetical protein